MSNRKCLLVRDDYKAQQRLDFCVIFFISISILMLLHYACIVQNFCFHFRSDQLPPVCTPQQVASRLPYVQLLLLSAIESEHEVDHRARVDGVVAETRVWLQLLAGVDEALLVRADAVHALDLVHQGAHSGGTVDAHADGAVGDEAHEQLHARVHSLVCHWSVGGPLL